MLASRFASPESKLATGMRTMASTLPSDAITALPSSVLERPSTECIL